MVRTRERFNRGLVALVGAVGRYINGVENGNIHGMIG